jgi:eukaryotic-like serine/threonine-protein kinase
VALTTSVPGDTAQVRDFFQRRLGLFALVLFFLDFGFYALTRFLEILFGVFRLEVLLEADELAHLASCLVLLAMWLACRRAPWSQAALARIDAGGFILVGFFYGLMGAAMAGSEGDLPRFLSGAFASMVMLVAFTNTAIGRAVLVPTSARRTLWITLAGFAPILVAIVYLRVYRTGVPVAVQVIGIIEFAAYGALPVVLSAVTARVIYGLREKVREATQLGQYTLEEKIGEGGMGEVYRARHAMLRRPTAIKLLPAEKAGEKSVARFEREVQLTSRLTHPNTVAIYDFGRTPDGVFYYAMEFLDGIDLEELVRSEGRQGPSRAVHILTQVCGALAEAHGVGLIHRDIKPANILLCERGGQQDVAKVVDFGLVKDRIGGGDDVSVTAAQTITGTPLYLSPEAIRSPDEVDARSDLYALGAVAYFLLSGRPVFDATNVVELCSHHLHTEPTPPALRIGIALPEALSAMVMKCLAKRREDRPQSAEELRAALLACGVAPWSDAEARAWWRARGQAVQARRHAAAVPVEPHAATVAIDLRLRGGL